MSNDVRAPIGYSERTERRPYFYANAHEKDFVPLKPAEVAIADARGLGCSIIPVRFMTRPEIVLLELG